MDWRFFLPEPELGRVALGGTRDPSLNAALTGLTGSPVAALQAAPAGRDPSSPEAFDAVVLSRPVTRTDLIAAAAAVGEHGHLVIELDGPVLTTGRLGMRPGTATRITRSLRAGGFDVREWLAWPSVDRATAFARADDPLAIRGWITRRFGRRASAIMAAASPGRIGWSALAAMAPASVLVARRSELPASLVERRLRLDGAPPSGLLVLAPRYRASAHLVALAIAPDGTIERVAKVARLRDDTSLAHEAAVLAALRRAGKAATSGPRLVDAPGLATEVGGDPWPILVEAGVQGEPLDPPAVRRDRGGAVTAITAWLASLPVDPAGNRTIDVPTRLDAALVAVGRLDDGSADGRLLMGLVERTKPFFAKLASASIPRVFEHGDPAHPNLLRRADGGIAAVDWERGERDGLPLHDLTIALGYVAAAARGAATASDQAAAFRAAMTGDDPWAAAALDRDLARLGCDPDWRPILVIAAWARSAAWLADHLADTTATSDLTRWLAADRSVASWAGALDLVERA
ncbi:MAG TPA: hypothetical protein VGQ02_03700 [Candidatus Limnocylindrales bacterium]|nr:hypothetical protein [Candidatus Limnocylindrales bacterium]